MGYKHKSEKFSGESPYIGYLTGECLNLDQYEYDGLSPEEVGAMKLVLRKNDVMLALGNDRHQINLQDLANKTVLGCCAFTG